MKEVLDLVSTKVLLKLMPRQMVTHVRDEKPKTLEAAANLANNFMVNRGRTMTWPLNRTDLLTMVDSTRRMGDLIVVANSTVQRESKSPQPHRSRLGRNKIRIVEAYQN